MKSGAIETRSDEFFSDNDDPVLLNTSVMYVRIIHIPLKKLNNTPVNVMKNARFACGLWNFLKAEAMRPQKDFLLLTPSLAVSDFS